MKNIAIIGYAPSSSEAPFLSNSYEFWTMNARPFKFPKSDKHFDLHNTNCFPEAYNYYIEYLKTRGKQAILTGIDERFPEATIFPKDEILSKYEEKFFTSSIAWFLAYAIELQPKKIGLWGIDLSCRFEYIKQRPPVLELIRIAKNKGIEIVLPKDSPLLRSREGDDWDKFEPDIFYYNMNP